MSILACMHRSISKLFRNYRIVAVGVIIAIVGLLCSPTNAISEKKKKTKKNITKYYNQRNLPKISTSNDRQVLNETRSVTIPGTQEKLHVLETKPNNIATTLIPREWPETIPWRPLRHFGPFKSGSELGEIQVHVNGNSAQWYYNDFFAGVDQHALDVYKIYFRQNYESDPLESGVPPTNNYTPELMHYPAIPQSSYLSNVPRYGFDVTTFSDGWANNLLLSLDEVYFSSLYGGSVAMKFVMADVPTINNDEVAFHEDDYEYEFGKDEYYFDVKRLIMTVYVNTRHDQINPKRNTIRFNVPMAVNFETENVTAYMNSIQIPFEEASGTFNDILTHVSNSVVSNLSSGYRPQAKLFAHAWIHNQYKGIIDNDEKVTKLMISDDFSDVKTDLYKQYIFAVWQIKGLHQWAVWDEGEYKLRIKVKHSYAYDTNNDGFYDEADKFEVQNKVYFIDEGDGSPWIVIGGWKPEELENFNHIELEIKIKELDPIWDDHFEILTLDLHLDKGKILAQAAQPQYQGVVHGGLFSDSGSLFEDVGWAFGIEEVKEVGSSATVDIWWLGYVQIVAR